MNQMPSLKESEVREWLRQANQLLWREPRIFGDVFVESGTYLGDSVPVALRVFPSVHTIEISSELCEAARRRFAHDARVTCHLGNSPDVLATLLPSLGQIPTVFWLDAHWSKGQTSFHSVHVPLLHELQVICDKALGPCLIVIDDVRLFGRFEEGIDWSAVTHKRVLDIVAPRALTSWSAASSLGQQDRLIVVLRSRAR
jgi:hypothetical protein